MARANMQMLRSTFLLTLYAACLCLVLSFILFEVLDIDGSDFPTPISRAVTVVKLAEPPHDLKRGYGEPPAESWISVSLDAEVTRQDVLQRRARLAQSQPSAAGPLRDRSTLARSALPGPVHFA